MGEIELRAAEAGDVAALIGLFETSWRTHWGPHVSAASRLRFETERPAKGYTEALWADFVVATRDDVVVGVFHLENDYLHAIHVAADQLGVGVGRILMNEAELAGARRLEVREFNMRARGFYHNRGWREVGRQQDTEMGTPVTTIAMELPV